MEEEKELKAVKITNPDYLGLMGPFINSFLERVPLNGITYETMYAGLAATVQHGRNRKEQGLRDVAELWVVFEDDKPIAFAHWHVKPLPYVGTVRCDYIFSWNRKKDPVRLLMKEFVRFAKDNRCLRIDATLQNEPVYKVFEKVARHMGLEIVRDNTINVMVKVNGKRS